MIHKANEYGGSENPKQVQSRDAGGAAEDVRGTAPGGEGRQDHGAGHADKLPWSTGEVRNGQPWTRYFPSLGVVSPKPRQGRLHEAWSARG